MENLEGFWSPAMSLELKFLSALHWEFSGFLWDVHGIC
jgi:hypothetical protein